jgi:phage shock protein PspC (stress-responsive transcriptional regulator)
MTCLHCSREIPDEAAFCQFCGASQQSTNDASSGRRLRRSRVERQVAGVCGGIAGYFDIDPVFVRAAWVVLTIVPGAIFLGVIAYLVAWLIIPDAAAGAETLPASGKASSWRSKRLSRSVSDQKIGGVCGGIAEYFGGDPTAVRLLWAVLTIFPGAILCGVLAYIAAWIIMPLAQPAAAEPPGEPAPV